MMVTKVSGKRIRSNHQRRIMDWLADGGGTVSEVAEALSMRLPHASAALKQLRQSGYVVRDNDVIRGSKLRLSAQGLTRLEEDGFSSLETLVRWPPPPSAAGIVLAREGSMLLLGYAIKPPGPLLGLPDRPMDESSGTIRISTGNEGDGSNWRWAVTKEGGLTWWDLESKRRTSPPSISSSSSTLAAWMEQPKVMGVVRAKLLDDQIPWPMGVGSWFESLPVGHWPELPQYLKDGEFILGRAGNSGPEVKPRGGVHARAGKRADQSLILKTVSSEVICLADANLVDRSSKPLPNRILRYWLKQIHPRLSNHLVDERFERLIVDLNQGRSNLLTRKVSLDFPAKTWSSNQSLDLDSTGLSLRAARSVLAYLLDERDEPMVIHWRWPGQIEELHRLTSDSRCRLVLTERSSLPLPFVLSSKEKIGHFTLELPGRIKVPITLDSQTRTAPAEWVEPKTPSELVRGNSSNPELPKNQRQAVWTACSLAKPNDLWADKIETTYPLAAWIACSSETRRSRWRRIGNSLNAEWVLLEDLDSFDLEILSELAIDLPQAMDLVLNKLRQNPLIVYSKPNLLDLPGIACAVLLSKMWFESPLDVSSTYLSHPLRVKQVLKECWDSDILINLISACPHHSILYHNPPSDRDSILGIMEDVHHSLWQEHALEWLKLFLTTSIGRSALCDLDVPWPILLSDKELNSSELSLIHHMGDGVGKISLIDVFNSLQSKENHRPPPICNSHPLAGWLFYPHVPNIPNKCEGDLEIHLALHRRIQQ